MRGLDGRPELVRSRAEEEVSARLPRLRFEISSPQYYQYQYKLGGPPITVQLPKGGTPKGLSGGQEWSAYARGDLDGDGKIAWFIREGYERNGQMVTASGIAMQDPEE
ncbi:MAG: hypothetical protein ACMG6S_19305 [Byssovorax sp.]